MVIVWSLITALGVLSSTKNKQHQTNADREYVQHAH
jgi:hypothetical protein